MSIEKKYYTVTDKETVNLLIQHINESNVIAYDTETDSLNMRKGKVVGFSVSGDIGIGFYMPTMAWNHATETLDELQIEGIGCHTLAKKILSMLVGKKLVMHNASFDCRFTKNFYGVNLLDSLWVDTALLVHTVQEEGAGMGVFGLKPLAISIQEHIGLDVEKAANEEQIELKESIKRNGGSVTKESFEIYKADMDILSKYAAADTDLTLRVCTYFIQKLKEEGLEEFFFEEEVMPLYREVTIPMEEMGVDLDLALLEETKEEIIEDLAKNKKIVLDSILALPAGKEWVVDTALKEFPPSHKGTWAQYLAMRYSLPLPKSDKTGKYSITQKTVAELEDSPAKEYLLTGNLDVLNEMEVLKISMALWKEKNDGEYINIQSKKHLGELVFDYMGIKPLVSGANTKSGRDKFDMDMIEELSKDYEWAENLRIYNKLLKIKSTYIDRFVDNHEDGRYYFYFKQNGTVSGRYGSDAQQLPKPKEEGEDAPIIVKYTNIVRAFLTSGPGRKIIDADYESLEPHCFASVSGDVNLQEIFNNGWDFYSTVAIRTEKLDEQRDKYPDGVSADKRAPNYLKKLDPVKRNQAKAYSLGIAYGMEAYALGMTLGISQKEAEVLVDGYLNGFPQLKQWRINSRKQVKEHGFIKNKVGRIRHLPKVKKMYDTFGDQIMDWKFRKDLSERYGKDQVLQWYRDYRNGLNNCLNYQLQSLAAAVVNRAAVQINRKLKELGIDGRVQAQVHDQLIINVPEDQAEFVAPIVKEIMESTTKLEGVTLKAPPEISYNWRDGH
jgi:DNA polymerase I-like protein with 3'-5' exonuclease and polymerase domains